MEPTYRTTQVLQRAQFQLIVSDLCVPVPVPWAVALPRWLCVYVLCLGLMVAWSLGRAMLLQEWGTGHCVSRHQVWTDQDTQRWER